MNIEAWKKLRETVANSDETGFSFDMASWGDESKFEEHCGTAACLAGFACLSVGKDPANTLIGVELEASEILGVRGMKDRFHVFMGQWIYGRELSKITKEEALQYIDKAIAEGDYRVTI